MALITCKECKTQISDTSRRCPNCGAKYSQAIGYDLLQKTTRAIFSFMLILIGIGGFVYFTHMKTSEIVVVGIVAISSLFMIILGIIFIILSLSLKKK